MTMNKVDTTIRNDSDQPASLTLTNEEGFTESPTRYTVSPGSSYGPFSASDIEARVKRPEGSGDSDPPVFLTGEVVADVFNGRERDIQAVGDFNHDDYPGSKIPIPAGETVTIRPKLDADDEGNIRGERLHIRFEAV